jgi:hypothetical protein
VKERLIDARRTVETDWRTTAELLRSYGEAELALGLEAFVRAMPAVRTEKEQIAAGLLTEIEAERQRAMSKEPQPDRR